MTPSTFPPLIAAITDRPTSEVRQRMRAAREAGFFPSGKSVRITATDVARLVIALACDRVADVGPAISAMRQLPRQTPDGPPGNLEQSLVALIATVPRSPVLGDLDIASGQLAIDLEHRELVWHVHDLFGRPATVRYSSNPTPPSAVATTVIVPFSTLRELSARLIT